MISLKGKWAFISGASRGIGALTAEFMAEQGCNLILHSRDLKHTGETLERVRAAGVEVYAVEADLASHQAVVRMLADIENRGTAVGVVCNNAAIQTPYREDFWHTPETDFDLSFRVNLTAIATICYFFMPKMIARGFGRVINTTSGIKEQPQQPAYSASKAALDKYTTDLATAVQLSCSLQPPSTSHSQLGYPSP
jgi:3-oxoacyl-[acyl-carrier protein] reductase